MRRRDIVTVAGGDYASKPRPAVIVQDDRFDATDSATVCLFIPTVIDAPLRRLPVTGDVGNGLDQDSYVLIDSMTRIRCSNAHAVVGDSVPLASSSSKGACWSSSALEPERALQRLCTPVNHDDWRKSPGRRSRRTEEPGLVGWVSRRWRVVVVGSSRNALTRMDADLPVATCT